jgi:hypothetical protein
VSVLLPRPTFLQQLQLPPASGGLARRLLAQIRPWSAPPALALSSVPLAFVPSSSTRTLAQGSPFASSTARLESNTRTRWCWALPRRFSVAQGPHDPPPAQGGFSLSVLRNILAPVGSSGSGKSIVVLGTAPPDSVAQGPDNSGDPPLPPSTIAAIYQVRATEIPLLLHAGLCTPDPTSP